MLCLLAAGTAVGQENKEKKDEPAFPSPAVAVAGDVAATEAQIVELLRRADAGLRVDLRILRRHLLRRATTLGVEDAAGRAALLRAGDLVPLIEAADAAAVADPDAAAAVNERTFALADQHPDALLDGLGRLTLAALGTAAPAELPPMRPAVETTSGGATPDRPAPPESATTIAGRLRGMPVSAELRRQLAALAGRAQDDPAATADLRKAAALADGIVRGAGVDDAERRLVEGQLADALMLLGDPRLADLGRERMAGLDGFAALVAGTRDLPGGGAGGDFATLIAAARREPENAEAILAVVRDYHAEAGRRAAAPDAEAVRRSSGTKWARAVERLRAAYDRQQNRLLTAARQYGQPGALMAATPQTMADWTAELRRLNDLIAVAARAPELAAEVERSLRVAPTGGLEKAAAVALVAADDPADSPERRAADEALRGLALLSAELAKAGELATAMNAISPEVDRDYAGGAAATLAARHRDALSTAAAQLAADGPLPDGWLDGVRGRVATIARVAEAVGEAADLDATIRTAGTVDRWADWTLDAAALLAMYEPYRLRLARAASLADTEQAAGAWAEFAAERDRMRPMTALVADVAGRADDAASLLAGADATAVAAARLETDSADAPYAAERLASAAGRVWVAVRLDPEADRAVLDELLKRLREEHGYE